MSKFGYQPKPLLPPDFEEFLIYQRELNSIIRDNLHSIKKPNLEEVNKKSKDNNNGELRNRNRSVKSNVHQLTGRNPTSSRK
jgi:hypothetical protein